MAFFVSSMLPFVVAGLMAIVGAMSWRAQLSSPLAYALVCFLLVLGVHHLVKAIVAVVKNLWPIGGGYYLVRPTTEAEIAAIERQMTIEGLAVAAAVALLSYPLIALVRGGFEK
jgi:hypothetical protein